MSAADVSEVIDRGKGPFVGSAQPVRVPDGWVAEERVAAGTATSYRAAGELPSDGCFELVEDGSATYRTRIFVARPGDPRDFNGTVVVEWLNVSGGVDASPDRTLLADELQRGYAWVGVSAQHIGVEGGAVLVSTPTASDLPGKGLRSIDPERYATLSHPGDAFSYDIYTQVARAIRAGVVLGVLTPERILAVGESQSAFALTTYANGVHPLVREFDGILVHSRGGGFAPLGEPGQGIDMVSAMTSSPTTIRTDLGVPVLILETETDLTVLGYLRSRQDDTDDIRLWEIAGAAHADRFITGAFADSLGCGGPVNDGPHRFVARAALRALDRWVQTGEAPPIADRFAVDGAVLQRDGDGIVVGGIRTAAVDVPVATLSGEPRPGASMICLLFGSTTPFGEERLAALYGSADEYLAAYAAATDAAIAAGYVVPEDRDAVLATAEPERIGG